MPRILLALVALLVAPGLARADTFDNYTNDILQKVPGAPGVQKVKELTPVLLTDHVGVLPGTSSAFIVVRTNDGRFAKLLVNPARQKVGDKSVPIFLIERFVTFKEGEERQVSSQGQNIRLFADFQFNLDIGQVVPAVVGGDLRFVVADGKQYVEPVGKAELYLLTKPLAEAKAKKTDKLVVGATFDPKYFNGVYKLYDDGRRSGMLHLTLGPDNEISGHYFSDKDGAKYEVAGKVTMPTHSIQFTIIFPKTRQQFYGFLFTGDGRVMTGFSRLQERETGFYAVRKEE